MSHGISDGATDLFGLPLVPEKRRGRPAHAWTPENSNKVNLLFACGRKPTEVAHVLGITKPTFYKHYFNEIERSKFAPLMMRAEQLARLNKAAAEGNVAAEKALAGMIQAEQARAINDRYGATPKTEPKAPAAAKLGKKEEQQAAANLVGGIFGVPEAPQLLQ